MRERLKEVRAILKMSQKRFVENTDVSANAVASFESGKSKKMCKHTIKLICERHKINPEWLRHGHGEMFLQSEKAASMTPKKFRSKFHNELFEKVENMSEKQAGLLYKFIILYGEYSP
jgi:transcriptional regulator with XRE-family HTH domain